MDAPARQFRIGRCLGRGGHGEVYQATMVSPSGLTTEVALKVLRSDLELAPEAARRLLDEGRLLGRMNHPVIVRAYDLARIDGRLGLVTELVDGDDLDRCLQPARTAPATLPGTPPIGGRALVSAIGQVAAALDAAWSTPGPDGEPMGIVHRDLKPSNVRIGRHGQVKLLDFGIARFGAHASAHTRSEIVVGSVGYLAPERFAELQVAQPASDVFGLGCCLYEGLVGERFNPDGFRESSARALDPGAFEHHRRDRLARLADRDVPPALAALVAACLAFEPEARPTSREMARVCEEGADAMGGPSLRRFCAERAWNPPPPVKGSLEGRVLIEGELGLVTELARPADVRPTRLAIPRGTADSSAAGVDAARLAAFEVLDGRQAPADGRGAGALGGSSGAEDSGAAPGWGRTTAASGSGIVGPEALGAARAPALPIGVTLLAEEPRIVSADSIDRPRTPTTSIPPPHPARLRSWMAGFGAVGCAAAVGLTATVAALAVLIGWVVLG